MITTVAPFAPQTCEEIVLRRLSPAEARRRRRVSHMMRLAHHKCMHAKANRDDGDHAHAPQREHGNPVDALHAPDLPRFVAPVHQRRPRGATRSQITFLSRVSSSGDMQISFVVSRRGFRCMEHCRCASTRRERSNARSCRAMHVCAVLCSARSARRYGRSRLPSSSRPSSDAPCAPQLTRFQASAILPLNRFSPSWMRSRRNGVNDFQFGIHEGPLPQGGEGMRVPASERWGSPAHKAAGLCGQREETPLQPPAPFSRGARKCVPHPFMQRWSSPVALAPATSSGDGLGIHEPGSNMQGGFSIATALPGRARDRAMCPAVARSSFRSAA